MVRDNRKKRISPTGVILLNIESLANIFGITKPVITPIMVVTQSLAIILKIQENE